MKNKERRICTGKWVSERCREWVLSTDKRSHWSTCFFFVSKKMYPFVSFWSHNVCLTLVLSLSVALISEHDTSRNTFYIGFLYFAVWFGAHCSRRSSQGWSCFRNRKWEACQRIYGKRAACPWRNSCHGSLVYMLFLLSLTTKKSKISEGTKGEKRPRCSQFCKGSHLSCWLQMVKERLSQQDSLENGWLLDGYPRSVSQATALKKLGFDPDIFILLEVRFCCWSWYFLINSSSLVKW